MMVTAAASDSGMASFSSAMDHVAQAFEALGALILVVGVLWSAVLAILAWRRSREPGRAYNALRQAFGGTLLLALEVLVAADLIRTVAVSPTLTNVLVLGLIVLIRTFLSFSLEIEIDGIPPWRRALTSGASTIKRATTTALSPGPADSDLPQAGKQVVFGDRCARGIEGLDEVFPAERSLGDFSRDLAEPRVLDLASVRQQGFAFAFQYRPDVDRSGDSLLSGLRLLTHFVGELTLVGHVGAKFAQCLPNLAPVTTAHCGLVKLGRDTALCDRGSRCQAGMDVIRMLVHAFVVVGDDYLGPVGLNQAGDPACDHVHGNVAERIRTVLVLPLRHTRVVITE